MQGSIGTMATTTPSEASASAPPPETPTARVCAAISTFMANNRDRICQGIGLVCDGHEFPTVEHADGRVWLDDDSDFWAEYSVPFASASLASAVDAAEVSKHIRRRLRRDLHCDTGPVTLTYEADVQRLVVLAQIYCYDG